MPESGTTEPRWLFTPEELSKTPSILRGMSQHEELINRQTAAAHIRNIGLQMKQYSKKPTGLCINTAMVYMHRFYVFHSFQKYPAETMAPCCLFLAAKVEETPIKLDYVVKTSYMFQNPCGPTLTEKKSKELQKELITNENLLLQTLGFDLIVAHPHTSVITCGDLVGASKSITGLAYDLATNSLHFTTMCLRYKPTTVACVCLQLAFKGNSLVIGSSKEGKEWWNYLEPDIKFETINELTKEYIALIERCKKSFNKWLTHKYQASATSTPSSASSTPTTTNSVNIKT